MLSKQGPVPRSVATCRQLSQQGRHAMERGDWQRAEMLLSQAIQSCPVDSDARRHYAEVLWHRGAAAEAIIQLEEARRLSTEDIVLALRVGQLYLESGRFGDALVVSEQALDLDSKSAEAWALRGRVLQATGKVREALADYHRSLGYSPGNPEVLLFVAEAYRQLSQPERALAALQTLLDTFPPGEEPQQVLHLEGLALMALGRYDDAAETLAMALQRGRPTSELYCRLGEAQLLAGRLTETHAAVQQALALDPNYAPTRALIARLAAVHNPDTASIQR